MNKHITYFDFLRGIAILMVIGIHTFPKNSININNDIIDIIIRLSLNCAVPIFLTLSAFFISNKPLNNKIEIHSFLKKQIKKVYIPCIIWSIPLFITYLYEGNNFYIELIKLLICGYSIYYFVALIIQFYFLTPFLIKICHNNNKKITFIISFFISLISISTYIYSGIKLPIILYAGPFWVWIIFYIQGIYISRTKRDYSWIKLFILLLLAIVLQIVELNYLYNIKGSGLGIKASAFIYSIIAVYILFSKKLENLYENKKNHIKSIIEYIGKISFGIYLIHCYFISGLDYYFSFDNWFIRWILTLFLSVVFIKFITTIIPSKITAKYLGFYD